MKVRKSQIGVGGAIITSEIKKNIAQVLKTGRISYGPFLQKFEADFAKLAHAKFAVSSNSGTSSLQVAIHALKELRDWADQDEVIVPAVTFVATSNTVLQNRLKPIFVDVDKKTYNIDPAEIEKKITSKTRAIIPVHLCGLPCDMDAIMKIARKYKLAVIEDACEAAGAVYKGKPVGSFGDVACFSSYMAHLVTTGVGGVAVTNDSELAVKMRSLVNHGRDSIYISIDDDKKKRGKPKFEIVNRRFRFESLGYSYRLTEFEGALGVVELKHLPERLKTRARNAQALVKGLKPFSSYLQLPYAPVGYRHAFMMFPIVIIDSHISRDTLVAALEDNNIETRYLLPLLNQPLYQRLFGNIEPQYPVAAFLNRNAFYIGCHPAMTEKDIQYVVKIFKKFFQDSK